jgi:hypothetical protein
MSLKQIYTCSVCGKNNFKSENGLRVHVVRVHPDDISTLEKKPFPCDLCARSFADRPGLSHHRAEHKNIEKMKAKILEAKTIEANNRNKELRHELNLINERVNRERGLEHRIDSLKKLLSDSEGELERMKYQYYRLFAKQLHIVPISSPTHLDVITEKDYRKILHSESDAPGVFVSTVYFNPQSTERQSFVVYRNRLQEVHAQRFDGVVSPEIVSVRKLVEEVLQCFCDTVARCVPKFSLPRDQNSYAYQKQEKLKRLIDEMNFSSHARERIIYKLTEACIEASKHTVKYMLLN